MSELPKNYDPKAVEAKWYAHDLEQGLFHGEPAQGGAPYVVVIPPPNVTGILHMGHALNNTIQDVLVRWRRMQGRNVVWVPGTDHAGIATQNVVERALKKEGVRRQDLGREKFLERVWQWREEYGGTIIRQLKQLGCSCDWARERFTMDEGLSRAVTEVFVRLHEKGLIYRGHYIINWCPRCGTALSDEESEHKAVHGKLYHIRYPREDGAGFVVVATTRPETLLGDTAVAVNPKDERYRDLVGKHLLLPVLGRRIPVIADDFVDPAFGTGCVKVTPAHDPNDYEMGRRHGLPQINVMHDDATMNDAAGPYAGQPRMDCRKHILHDLEKAGLMEKIEDHEHAVGHCYRCDSIVEPRLSPQWFVRMKPLAGAAVAAVRSGEVRFIPDRWSKVYLDWMENIRDWCISRQIWWGHRIPVWYCDACRKEFALREAPAACPSCGAAGLRQDEDVLDTWFSSWLWPFSVFGWPEKNPDLDFYYPTHTLVTASEIIFFWVARMIMSGQEFMGRPPFSEVYIHGTVRDDQGRKMSKSLGNSIDPLDIIREYSADALRSSLMMLTATGQDVYIKKEKFEVGRNFGTKIWNAARFIQMNSPEGVPADFADPALDPALLRADDLHILARLSEAVRAADEHLGRFRFNDYALSVYDFVWHQFCDWYIEYAKEALGGADAARKAQVVRLLHHVLSESLKLLHPLMPFITQELWQAMGYATAHPDLLRAPWPVARPAERLAALGATPEVVDYVDGRHELVQAIRQRRADFGLTPKQKTEVLIQPADAALGARLEADRDTIARLAQSSRVELLGDRPAPADAANAVCRVGSVYLPLGDVIDRKAELAKLRAQIEEAEKGLEGVARKLSNPDFVSRAKPEVVQVQMNRKAELEERIGKIRALMTALGG